MPFFNFIQFCFQINDSSRIVAQKNRRFGMKKETDQKIGGIMHTRSYRRILYQLSKLRLTVELLQNHNHIIQTSQKPILNSLEHHCKYSDNFQHKAAILRSLEAQYSTRYDSDTLLTSDRATEDSLPLNGAKNQAIG
jgi:hypothetical protein